jgi:hypothetical protein
MALALCDVRRDPVANRALDELKRHYTVTEERSGLVLTQKTGNMKLFLNDLDDLHQWDFIHNQRLHALLRTIDAQRERWKRRALVAEAKLVESAENMTNNGGSQSISDFRYAALPNLTAFANPRFGQFRYRLSGWRCGKGDAGGCFHPRPRWSVVQACLFGHQSDRRTIKPGHSRSRR